jgi:hypothetical protein
MAGFDHHATLSIAAYGFLVSERETIRLFKELAVSASYRPRGASNKNGASYPKLSGNHKAAAHHCAHPAPLSMSVLHSANQTDNAPRFVTQ